MLTSILKYLTRRFFVSFHFDNLLFFFLIFFLLKSNNIIAEAKLAYLDLELLISQSLAGKSITTQLENKHNKNLEKFKFIENQLKNEEEKILLQKNVIKKIEYEKKIIELRSKANNFSQERSKFIDILNDDKINSTNKLLNEINPILTEYSSKNLISIIFQKKNIIIGKSELDITDDILKLLDKKVKEIKLN